MCARCFQTLKHLLTMRVPQLSHRKCLQSTELLEFYTPKICGFSYLLSQLVWAWKTLSSLAVPGLVFVSGMKCLLAWCACVESSLHKVPL